jgi:hypothetical protein
MNSRSGGWQRVIEYIMPMLVEAAIAALMGLAHEIGRRARRYHPDNEGRSWSEGRRP